ncbi:glutaminyl-peptide cyclotransferase [Salidesulfovibrio onnuriiensis]|uniref:glutaminyl-peptide cyclotransferase n=1 Tax=Salidesulfovibrio onnuriiensis TaxID=2583823 RepID=UPI0011C729BA|nr:glutaminyl-peptide cyclotransferase [Salidesulfovibrio onnuriiensis]
MANRLVSTTLVLLLALWSIPVLAGTPVIPAEVLAQYPHDPHASTQGLACLGDVLVEITGEYGHSSIRKVRPETGEVLRKTALSPDHFGEGVAIVDGSAYVLTWLSGDGYIFDVSDFDESWPDFVQLGTFAIPVADEAAEGWGLAFDGRSLILSNGSAVLQWIDPVSFDVTRTARVMNVRKEVRFLNELEWVNGWLLANVWKRDSIAVIDPETGLVAAWIDLTPLLTPRNKRAGVANGIAYDAANNRLFVTGKLWDTLYAIKVPELLKGKK